MPISSRPLSAAPISAPGGASAVIVQVGAAHETDAAGIIGVNQVVVSVGTASESSTAGTATPLKIAHIGAASEAGSAGEIRPVTVIPVRTASEIDSTKPVTIPVLVVVGTASESSGAGDIGAPALYHVDIPNLLAVTGPAILLFNDWSAAIPETALYRYVMDLTGDTDVRIPIRSWQATLRADVSSYVQCVIPNAGDWASDINTRLGNDFVITRRAILPDGTIFDQEIARAPADVPDFARGPTNYSCTLSGYAIQFYTPDAIETITRRTLREIRTLHSGSQTRVRCALDWFLRPAQQAVADGDEFTVEYINYYVTERDEYMDVGGVAA